jgi:hypothetical protein
LCGGRSIIRPICGRVSYEVALSYGGQPEPELDQERRSLSHATAARVLAEPGQAGTPVLQRASPPKDELTDSCKAEAVGALAESLDEVRRVYFFGCAVGGSSPLSRRYIATEL